MGSDENLQARGNGLIHSVCLQDNEQGGGGFLVEILMNDTNGDVTRIMEGEDKGVRGGGRTERRKCQGAKLLLTVRLTDLVSYYNRPFA